VIALMVAISTFLNFIQEARSTKAADALKAMVSNTATVLRVANEQGKPLDGDPARPTGTWRYRQAGGGRYDPG
jgi:hypothetical protein